MKKLLFFLILLAHLSGFGQNSQTTITVCNFWVSSPDLLETTFSNYDPSIHTYTLHQTTAGALENTNLIPVGIAITTSMTLYLRIVNTNTQEISIEALTILISPLVLSGATTLDAPTSSAICSVESGGTAPFTFTWSIEGAVFTEGSTSTLTIPPSNQESTITCIVTDAVGCTSTISIQIVSAASAFDDTITLTTSEIEIVTSSTSVYANDYLNFQSLTFPVIQQQAYLEETGEGWDNFNLNPNGTISALPGTPAGIYNLQYSLFHINGGFVGSASINLQVFSSTVELIAFVDWDGNGIKSDDEPLFTEGKFLISGSDGTELELYSDTGTYIYNTLPNTTYGFSYQVNDGSLPLFSCQTSFLDINPIAGSTTTYFFPINSIPEINGAVSLISYQMPSPGFTRYYEVKVKNIGSLPMVNAVLNVQKPENSNLVSYCNTCVATADGFQKTNITLAPFEEAILPFAVQFNTIPNIQLGDYVTTTAALVTENDVNPTDNISTLTQMVIGSYDPNDISEKHGPEVVFATWPSGEELEYTIRFENTGNGSAETVRLENTLPINVDALSFTPIDASHRYQLQQNGNQIIVVFNNIDLPPSQENTNIGHGYFKYKVSPTAGFQIGTVIENVAEIYFDFNPAIVTPLWTTTFVEQMSVAENKPLVQFYTNPVTDLFELTLEDNQANAFATVYDLKGSVLAKVETVNGKLQIETQNWMSGIYVVKLEAGEIVENVKLVKR
ncbi:T9SS type A sorting domain-containing protein [Flavobacterium sp.]|uniref:T9SS type A sorting domain-containing protein n=1 Tax=Flavobacterium sp. TaxID=239 RepID=UPI0026124619|nr:T9SS type A sorting domain-containing protein [Flavobacterium sp.]